MAAREGHKTRGFGCLQTPTTHREGNEEKEHEATGLRPQYHESRTQGWSEQRGRIKPWNDWLAFVSTRFRICRWRWDARQISGMLIGCLLRLSALWIKHNLDSIPVSPHWHVKWQAGWMLVFWLQRHSAVTSEALMIPGHRMLAQRWPWLNP